MVGHTSFNIIYELCIFNTSCNYKDNNNVETFETDKIYASFNSK